MCVCVCLDVWNTITVESLDVGSLFFSHLVCLPRIRVKVAYEGHQVNILPLESEYCLNASSPSGEGECMKKIS